MDCSSDSGTPLYSYHPYKKNSTNQTNRITGRGSTVLHTQQPKEARDLKNLLFGKEFKGCPVVKPRVNLTYFLGWLWQATSVTFSYFVLVGSASFSLIWDLFSQTVIGENFTRKIEWVMHICTSVLRSFTQSMFIVISSLFSVNKALLVPVLKVPQIKKT